MGLFRPSLAPGWVLRVAYSQVQDFNKFRYDWRADLRHSAAQLKDFIEGTTPTGGKWNLVGHSQGGLLIILASKLMDTPEWFSESVATVTLVGTLLAGTLNSAQAMLVGDNAGARLAPVIRRTIRTWPAIYQMLPSWPAVLKAGGTPAADSRQLKQPGGWPGVDDVQRFFTLPVIPTHLRPCLHGHPPTSSQRAASWRALRLVLAASGPTL